MTSYKEWQSRVLAPPWLRGPVATKFEEVLGEAKDLLIEAAKQAVKARFVALAPNDALAYIGSERNIERYPPESDDTYRSRLAAAWTTWEFAGTARGIIAALRAAGFTGPIRIYDVRVGPEGVTPWPPDGDTANWSRFWIEFDPPFPFAWNHRRWGDGRRWSDGWTWGSNATNAQITFVRAILRKWKAAHEICAGIRIRFPDGAGTYRVVTWPGMR